MIGSATMHTMAFLCRGLRCELKDVENEMVEPSQDFIKSYPETIPSLGLVSNY